MYEDDRDLRPDIRPQQNFVHKSMVLRPILNQDVVWYATRPMRSKFPLASNGRDWQGRNR